MSQSALFGPFFTVLLLTFVVWVYMFARRIPFIHGGGISDEDLLIPGALDRLSPLAVSSPSDNLKNLFEMPVLFYAMVLYLVSVQQVDSLYVSAAWVFAVFRCLHSLIHCTFNHVLMRFGVYLVSTVALWFIAGRAALQFILA